jgi:hypothetical protein
MKIGDSNLTTNFQPQNIGNDPAVIENTQSPPQQASLDSIEGPTGQTQQALQSDSGAEQHDNVTTDYLNGTALLVGAGAATFGIALPLSVMLADPEINQRVGDWADSAFDWVGGGIASFGHEVGGFFGDALDWLGGAVMNTPEALGEAVLWTGDAIKDAGEWIGEAFVDGASALGEAELDLVDGASDVVDEAAGAVSDAVSTVTDW